MRTTQKRFFRIGGILLGFFLILSALAYLFWPKAPTKTPAAVSSPEVSPTPTYPKVENFKVPILMYHYVRDASGESELGQKLSVSPQSFTAQMQWLRDNNFETITVSDLADPERKALSKIAFEKKRPIAITFDDGYADAYTDAYPILKKYDLTATFYIIRDSVGRGPYMNQSQIDELAENGFEIGSHSISHPDLSKMTGADLVEQIANSKEKAAAFCYPSGRYNNDVVAAVRQAGYTTAVTTEFGIADEQSDLLTLPRLRIENISATAFGQKIENALK